MVTHCPDCREVQMRAQTFVAGLAILSATLVSATPPSENQGTEKQPGDRQLELALTSPQAFMFGEQAISRTDPAFDLAVTSARGVQGKPEIVHIRPGTMRI